MTNQKNAGLAFSLAAVAPIVLMLIATVIMRIAASSSGDVRGTLDGYTKQNWYIYMSFLISQAGFFAVLLYFLKAKKVNTFKLLTVKAPPKYFLIGGLLALGLMFGLSYVNNLFVDLLNKLGLNAPDVAVPAVNNWGNYLFAMLVIAVIPAIFEELLLRGIILGGAKGFGTVHAVIGTGLLFALFHQNPSQTVYQFICGAVFALLTLRAGSVIPAVVMHFINNGYILTAYFLYPDYTMKGALNITVIVLALVLFAVCLTYLIFFDKKKTYPKQEGCRVFYTYAAAGIALCAFMWIAVLTV